MSVSPVILKRKEKLGIIASVFLILKKNNEIFLMRRANTGYEDGCYSLISGHLERMESLAEAMVREAREETGIDINICNLKLVHVGNRTKVSPKQDQERIDFYFMVDQWSGEPENIESNKCDDMRWFPLDDLPSNMIKFVRLAISKSLHGEHYSEFEI